MIDQFIGERVIVRTYSAGVHFGTLSQRDEKEALLTDARRIWRWEGAFTLSAVAQDGIKRGKLSRPVPSILLTEAIEIIPCSPGAVDSLTAMKEHKP